MNVTTILILLGIGLFAGAMSGMVGIGGGIIMVPCMVFFLAMSQHQAQGTSLAVLMFPVAALSVYNYYQKGFVDFKIAGIICAGFVLGSFVSSKMAVSMSPDVIKKVFGVVILLVAVKMILGK